MATNINRVLYSAQTALIGVGGYLHNGGTPGNPWTWQAQGTTIGGSASLEYYLLPVQTASADETIPQEDVLVLGKLSGVGRLQKDSASSKSSIKAYLVKDMDLVAQSTANEGTTVKAGPGGLAGKSLGKGGVGLLETLRQEAIGGWENQVTLNRPGGGKDGFMFHGVTSNISIDCAKGALPTIDLAFEGTGQLEEMYLTGKDASGNALDQSNAGLNYIDKCSPHNHADIEIWGYERDFDSDGEIDNEDVILIAADSGHSSYGTDASNVTVVPNVKEGTDTLGTAKLSFDMPTETLTALGENITGVTTDVREGNRTFSKPPFKATLTVDGQGVLLAGWSKSSVLGVPEESIVATAIKIGDLMAQIDKEGAATSARSFSQNVGDIGASYSVTVEGTDADFESN